MKETGGMALHKGLQRLRELRFIELFLLVALYAVGLFYEFLSCAASVALCVYLMVRTIKTGSLRLRGNLLSAAVAAVDLLYALSALWAVDSGMAVWGFFKILPAPLFLLALMQDPGARERALDLLPPAACVMTVTSAVLMQIPALRSLFSVAGRLSGFFQYANTFALFLLLALVVLVTGETLTWRTWVQAAILLGGILYSGSRTVFVLLLAAVAVLVIFHPQKRVRWGLAFVVLLGIGVAAGAALITGRMDSIGRFLTTSLTESTFVGRLLYFQDALPLILRHPFGLGYMGYYYIQPSIQTGVYSVMFIHNDFLQLLLDVGWIPALLLTAALVRAFFRRGAGLRTRLLLLLFAAHCCFDFDLQFTGMLLLLLTIAYREEGREWIWKKPRVPVVAGGAAAAALALYIGTAQLLSQVGQYGAALALYPGNTTARVALLTQETTADGMDQAADRILRQNTCLSVAYSAKARAAFARGDFQEVIRNKRLALERAPFASEEYEDYCRMLMTGIGLYEQAGDAYSAQVCRDELLQAAHQMETLDSRLSPLGKRIVDQPRTELAADIRAYRDALPAAD